MVRERLARLGMMYAHVLEILGSTGTILPIGDPASGKPNATTFTTIGDIQAVFTWSEAWSAFDGHDALADSDTFPYRYQGIIPIVKFNGTDEEADSPDATYWSRGDGTTDSAFSIGAWVNFPAATARQTILSKNKSTTGATAREWIFDVEADETFRLMIRDESAAVQPFRKANNVLVADVWHLLVATYDGTGGTTAANGIVMYDNGAVAASTATNDASYVAMENTTALVNLGFVIGASANVELYAGFMAGGPLGPFFTQVVLTADQIDRLYNLGRRALGV